MKKLSHYDKKGRVRMVDVTAKPATVAHGRGARIRAHAARDRGESATAEIAERRSAGDCANCGNHRGEAHLRADSALSPPGLDARGCEREAMPEWD